MHHHTSGLHTDAVVTGNDEWVEGTIQDIFETLESDLVPPPDPDCDYCSYAEEAAGVPRD